jgi:hypothetical protein
VLNTDSGALLNKLNAALSSKDLGKIDPRNMLNTIKALGSGILDEEISLDPHAGSGAPGYVYPDAKTEGKYGEFGQRVANMLKDAGAIQNASDVRMRHFPEKDGSGAGGDVYFIDESTGKKYRASSDGKKIVLREQGAGSDVLDETAWSDIATAGKADEEAKKRAGRGKSWTLVGGTKVDW